MSDNEQKNHQNEYYARVCIDEDFAYSQLQQGIEAGTKLYNDVYGGNTYKFYTYKTFPMEKHNSLSAVNDTIKYYWNKSFPGFADKMKVIAMPLQGKSEAVIDYMKKNIYDTFCGCDDFIRICTEIVEVLPILRSRTITDKFLGTSYLVAANPGCGFTKITLTMSVLLDKLELFEKTNDSYWDLVVSDKTENGCHSVDDIIDIVKKEDNQGTTMGLDICYFLDKNKHLELRDFLCRLNKYQNKFIFLFRVPFLEKEAINDIRNILSDVVCIKDIIVPPPSNIVLLEYLSDLLFAGNYDIDNKAIEIFFNKIKEEKRDGRFYGFKTVSKICNEICWMKAQKVFENASNNIASNDAMITADDIKSLCGSSLEEKSGYEMLNDLVGMDNITEQIKQIVAQVKLSINNKTFDRPCIHMRFLGAPGTGKTTVARIVGKIFKDEQILSKGEFIECAARSLCGQYVGQTAPRTAAVCRDAYGSVLFIDEAYSLYTGSDNDYGPEALATLIAEMENHRTDMVVIMAGYTDEMNTLMKGNAGLRSRMPYMIEFNNYSRQQLFDIFMLMVSKHFRYTQEFSDVAREYFDNLSDSIYKSKEFANARFVRNLYERTWSKAALRTTFTSGNGSAQGAANTIIDKYSLGDDSIILVAEDFRAASSEKEFAETDKVAVKPVGYKR